MAGTTATQGKTQNRGTPAGGNRDSGKKNGSCGSFIWILLIFIVITVIIPRIREKREEQQKKETMAAAETLWNAHEILEDYIEPDTRIIYADYDGIEKDIEYYQVDGSETMSEEERRSIALYELRNAHVYSEMVNAIANMEKQVCVIGRHSSSTRGYSRDRGSDIGFGKGVFRCMPYSSFWMENYKALTGTMPSSHVEKRIASKTYYIYSFSYYPLSADEIGEMKDQIVREADSIIYCIPKDADLWQKCKVIHDELIRRESYDYDFGPHCHDLYGALVLHKPVCEGYALAFDYILGRIGGKGDIVCSEWDGQPGSTTHAWNCFFSSSSYERYIDVTWDDREITDHNGEPVILYEYFGLTEEEIRAIDSHDFKSFIVGDLENPVPFNYYRHEDYMLPSFDEAQVIELLRQQYLAGSNCLTVRFATEDSYRKAHDVMTSDEGMRRIMNTALEYPDRYWGTCNDEIHTVSYVLGAWPGSGDE